MEPTEFKCKVCDLVLREPCNVNCCAAKFCTNCIKKWQAKNTRCPSCKTEDFEFMVNIGLKQKLLKSQVYCSKQSEGCTWIGELGKLDKHINSNPSPDKYLEGCHHVEIHCPHCPELGELFRKDMIEHWNKIHSSNGRFVSSEDATQESVEEQLADTVKKQDETKEQLKNELEEAMKSHFDKLKKQLHKDLNLHKQHMLKKVQTLEKESTKKDVEMLKSKVEEILLESEKLHEQIEMLRKELKDLSQRSLEVKDSQLHAQPIGPVIFEMPNYSERRQISGDNWYSSGFYTHAQGYKMCLNVCASGHKQGEGTHISVYLYLMKGEFDAYLKWPFRGRITVELINQSNRYVKVFPFDDDRSAATQRAVDVERNLSGRGFNMFLSHGEVEQYKNANDSLRFEITKVMIDKSQ